MLTHRSKFLCRRRGAFYAPVQLTGAAGGYGTAPMFLVLAFGPKLHTFYYLLSIIFYLYIRSDNPH